MSNACRTFPGGVGTDKVEKSGMPSSTTLVSYAGWVNLVSIPGGSDTNYLFDGTDRMYNTTVDTLRFLSRAWTVQDGIWSTANLPTGSWTHVAVTYNYGSTANTPVVWVSAVSQTMALVIAPSVTFAPGGSNWALGNGRGAATHALNGSMFGWGRWNGYTLTQADVTALNNGTPNCAIGLGWMVVYAPMDLGEDPEPNLGTLGGTLAVTGSTVGTGPTTVTDPRCAGQIGQMWLK